MSTIASQMRISVVCENQNPLVSLEAIASQMRRGRVYEESGQGPSSVTPQPVTAWEQPEFPQLSESSSVLSEAPTTSTLSGRVSPEEEGEIPRSLKRKRQPARLPATPSSSTRTTPAHSPSTVATSPGSPDVARKIRFLRLDSPSPIKDEALESPSRPRLRSEAKKLKTEMDTAKASSQALQHDLATVRARLEKEKRENAKLKAKAGKDKDDIEELRAGLKTLRSEFESEKLEKADMEKQLVDLWAKVEPLQHGFGGESDGGNTNINPETREEMAQIVHMNEVLRRVLQGERGYRNEMYGKLHSLREKVGPLLAKVDELQETIDVMKAHFSAHDAPIELIMDFVRNFHQWWVDRYNARREDADGEREPTGGPET
ncbi:uncharacterized protein N7473_006330 [Penicillium subrubescens]|nr:uncharacterized protein N7473_006330 [Penicillium subrubescens]KAJ5896931.1 hypothetical protein N7473_006330 [Penicillium subrubescens]